MTATVLATMSAPDVEITVVLGTDPEFRFDVMIDGVLFDSFTTQPAALSTAWSFFYRRAAKTM